MREEKEELDMLVGWMLYRYVGLCIYYLIFSFLHFGICWDL